ncbi:recombinase family protein [Myxosarcina sp. GI1]|uniref:recombinase family protein n=1 Tax=Myxosarcina sp. GI1 TaxID=1541065 RepID=UPI0005698563|nr:recombinase family protein [Myxosarcina sp. GI1]
MKIIAYLYSDPLLESPPDKNIWGLEVDRVYQDIGDREQLQQLIADCQAEAPNYLLIRRLEELGENFTAIGERLTLLESLEIEIIVTQQDYNLSELELKNSREKLINLTQLLQIVKENLSRDRLKRGHARNRLKALPPPGKAPYGYRRGQDKYIIDKSTAPVVKDFFERFLLFGSLRGAVRYLDRKYGKKISPSTGRSWLTNAVYRGDLKYKTDEVISNTHAAIISREEAAQIDRLLRRNSRFASHSASAPRSLAGLVVCQQCQYVMNITRVTRHHQKQEYLYLRCHQCPQKPKCKAIVYERILEQTIAKICLELPLAVAKLNIPNPKNIEQKIVQKITQKQEILAKIPELIAAEVLDRETALIRSYKLQTEISDLKAKTARLPPVNLQETVKAVALNQFWLDLSESERRFYFREFLKQIVLVRQESQEWDLQLVFIF